jgi:hypothetical protein
MRGLAAALIAKNRHGSEGLRLLAFAGPCMAFSELEPQRQADGADRGRFGDAEDTDGWGPGGSPK